MPSKHRGSSRTRKRKGGPEDESPQHTDIPRTSQRPFSGLGQDAVTPSIVVSPSNQRPIITDPTLDPLRPVEQPSIAADHFSPTGAVSLHSPNAQDYSGTSYPMTARTPPCQDPPATVESLNIEDENLQGGSFAGAHNFTIVNAYMNDGSRTGKDLRAKEERKAREERRSEEERKAREEEREAEERKREEKALEKLAAKGLPGAMLDSKDRGYVPRCNDDTRQTLRGHIVRWGRNDEESRRLLWLLGPAAVGKSAVAQTVAEELKKEGLLGAVFFFSRPNNRSDPDVVIPTLVYQLALLLRDYRRIITQQLISDPLVLNRSRRSQFKELIIDPFLTLTSYRPLLIILDGLDECKDRDAQCEFVEMISYHARKEKDLRLRWMICSRPEPDLKVSFSTDDCKAICVEVKLGVDDDEAQKDARRILETGFAGIRRKYPDQLSGSWPADDQVLFIADRASGHLGFVSFIIRFIGDNDYDDPSGQLDVCIKFLERTGSSTDVNPLLALDLLYTQILSDIPINILPTTQRILGLSIFYGNRDLSIITHANFLGLDQTAFYRSLRRLHSVILVPPASEAHRKSIQIYHASFSDYLKDPARSGNFVLEEVIHFDIAVLGLKWLGYGHIDPSKRVEPELTWIPPKASRKTLLDSLCRFSFTPCWKACVNVPEDSVETLFERLEEFDFNLDYVKWWREETDAFACFIRWLAAFGPFRTGTLIVDEYKPGTYCVIEHRDDHYSFFLPSLGYMRVLPAKGSLTMYLRVGKLNPTKFWLKVSRKYQPGFIVAPL